MRSRLVTMALLIVPTLPGCEQRSTTASSSSRVQVSLPPPATPSPILPPVPGRAQQTLTDGIAFREIPTGYFLMGSPPEELGREPQESQRLVPISFRYWMSATEITQEQFQRVTGRNPSRSVGANLPVTCVTYDDAVAFCQQLSDRPGQYRFRLPTEEEWEYACRAGSNLPFTVLNGEKQQAKLALDKYRAGDTDFLVRHVYRMAWFHQSQPRPVGTLSPNAWGLHDMHGNVWEWCNTDDTTNDLRPIRGGAWSSTHVLECRSALRAWQAMDSRKDSIGFRVLAQPVQR